MTDMLQNGPRDAPLTILLAHGAGAPMDTPFMTAIAEGLAARDLHVLRFEFAYMAARSHDGTRRPPPRAERLVDEYRAVVGELALQRPLVIGGKSFGGRVASMIAEELFLAGRAAGLLCLGYPFHAPGKPERLRTAHLAELTVPMLICQGDRDPFGALNEVPGFGISEAIGLHWLPDGDHDFRPRKASGETWEGNLSAAASAIARWTRSLLG